MDTKISKTSKILFYLRIVNCAILVLLLIKELFYNIIAFLVYSMFSSHSGSIIGGMISPFLLFPRFYVLLLLFFYRIKILYFLQPQYLTMFKNSFFTFKISRIYFSPALIYHLLIIFNTVCTAYFLQIFDFTEEATSLGNELFVALLLAPFTLFATFYDTQFAWHNVFYALMLNILYFIVGLLIITHTYISFSKPFILFEILGIL